MYLLRCTGKQPIVRVLVAQARLERVHRAVPCRRRSVRFRKRINEPPRAARSIYASGFECAVTFFRSISTARNTF